MTAAQTSSTRTANAQPTPLDRRRDKRQLAMTTKDAALADVASLDEQLTTNAGALTGYEADLQATLDRVATVKKTIKATTKDRDRLRTERKKAGKVAAKAEQRATAAEAKYDRAVLADMLRREKDNDLSAHTPSSSGTTPSAAATPVAGDTAAADTTAADIATPDTTSADTTAADTTAQSGTDSAAAKPPAHTARATAARITAARAQATTASVTAAPRTRRASSATNTSTADGSAG